MRKNRYLNQGAEQKSMGKITKKVQQEEVNYPWSGWSYCQRLIQFFERTNEGENLVPNKVGLIWSLLSSDHFSNKWMWEDSSTLHISSSLFERHGVSRCSGLKLLLSLKKSWPNSKRQAQDLALSYKNWWVLLHGLEFHFHQCHVMSLEGLGEKKPETVIQGPACVRLCFALCPYS